MAIKNVAWPSCLLLLILLPTGKASCEKDDPLPDAPSVHGSETGQFPRSKWFGVVDPGEKIPPLYTHDKMMFWLHEEFGPLSMLPAFTSAGWGQLVDSDPKYGTDSGAFGERLGAAVVRQTTFRFFADSLMPTLTHEDPRYFRMAYGPITQRGVYAAERVFVSQRDDGSHGFNYAGTLGRAMASALDCVLSAPKREREGGGADVWHLARGLGRDQPIS